MDLNKNLLFQKIKRRISLWFESEDNKLISNADVYRFLHFIKERSMELQLTGLYQLSGSLLDQVKATDKIEWRKNDLRDFLNDFISLTYEYENFTVIEKRTGQSLDENIPLIQIIDDNVSALILLKDVFEKKGWMVIANTISEKAITQYYDLSPDCVIIDFNLTETCGLEILAELQQHRSKLYVPKVMISIRNDKDTRIAAFRRGADDFIEKPIDLEELIVRIDRHLQRKQMYDHSALLDELTNLYNRRFLKDVFNRNMNDFRRHGQVFSIAILDFDYFKKINDTYGHIMGDKVLSSFALFLKENTRNSDTVFRYGGEEFVILFPNTNQSQAIEIVSRILDHFSEKPFNENGESFKVSFSAGVHSIVKPDITMEMALNVADQALYKAKEFGRARVVGTEESSIGLEKRKLFISVVDDDALIRTMLTRILQSMEITQYEINIQVFEDGLSFFQSNRLDQHGEHFLIVDGVMPIMDGLEILQKVKQTKNGRNVLVLMLTGRKSETDIARALKYGADDYITKPFSITELQARILRLIQRMK